MNKKRINYEYRQEMVTYFFDIAIIVIAVMLIFDMSSNLVLFPLIFLFCAINRITDLFFTLLNGVRNYGTTKGTRKKNIIKYLIILIISILLFCISVIVLW